MRVAGIMSGTSLDGIDVAICDIGRKIQVVAFSTAPYPKNVREAIMAVSDTMCHTGQISRLNFLLPELYAAEFAKLCKSSKIDPATVELIGCHGQTVFHQGKAAKLCGRPIRSTLQLGDGSVLAELTGIPVVSDFRTRDMAAGGHGAPLVPYLDYRMFRHAKLGRVALNLGGIANVTAIPPAATPDQVFAFDTGPANMVMDQIVEHFTGKRYDKGGAIAARGALNEDLLRRLLSDKYYRAAPPKSAGREQYGVDFVAKLLATGLSCQDLVATATAFTAITVARAIGEFIEPVMHVDEIIAGGGGVRNPRLMGMLAAGLPHIRMRTTSEFGIDTDTKEAVAFALMAYETYHGRPSNVPSATGAGKPAILGRISPAPR